MKTCYHLDAANYSLMQLRDNLSSRELIPSRQALKEGLEDKFEILGKMGILTLQDLLLALKTKKRIEDFSNSSGISFEYLNLLRREANSYLPNPVSLSKIPDISSLDLEKLEAIGIKNSRHLYERAGSEKDREELSRETGISLENLTELTGLSDLVRAYGVGPVFARILYDTGIHSIRDFVTYAPEQIIDLYEEKFQQKADFSLRDMHFSLDVARVLSLGVDF
jgi:replicative superfamily II helicase